MHEYYRIQTSSRLIGERLGLLAHEAEPGTVKGKLLECCVNSQLTGVMLTCLPRESSAPACPSRFDTGLRHHQTPLVVGTRRFQRSDAPTCQIAAKHLLQTDDLWLENIFEHLAHLRVDVWLILLCVGFVKDTANGTAALQFA